MREKTKKAARLIGLLLLASMLMTALSACRIGKEQAVVSVNGAEIDNEIFKYFLSHAYLKADSRANSRAIFTNAAEECVKYVAVNTEFKKRGLVLTSVGKAIMNSEVAPLWSVYSDFYKEIGVSKPTFVKIKQSQAYSDALRTEIFDIGGEKQVSEDLIKSYFAQNYVGFRALAGYFTTVDENGNTVRLPADKIEQIKKNFENAANRINSGSDIDEEAVLMYPGVSDEELGTDFVFLSRSDDGNYPEGFFDKVLELPYETARVLTFEDYIYIVIRSDITKDSLSYYKENRSDCFKAVTDSMMESEIISWAQDYKAVLNYEAAEKTLEKIAKKIDAYKEKSAEKAKALKA